MKTALLWLIPMAVGAVIGYVTNAIAIKMLFRPLREYRLFGLKVPFTPGILPRKRHKLAGSIASMVDQQLLTPEIVKGRIARDEFRLWVLSSIEKALGKFLQTPLLAFRQHDKQDDTAGDLLRKIIDESTISSIVEKFISWFVYSYRDKNLGEILGEKNVNALREGLENFLTDFLIRESPSICEFLDKRLEASFPELIGLVSGFLRSREIHRELETRGKKFLSQTMLRLNFFQRFFISAAQYDRTLNDKMGEIIDDLILNIEEALAEEKTRRAVIDSLKKGIAGFVSEREKVCSLVKTLLGQIEFSSPLAELLERLLGKDIFALGSDVAEKTRRLLAGEGSAGEVIDSILKTYGGLQVGELLRVDAEKQSLASAWLTGKIIQAAGKEAEAALSAIDIRAMVVERIDSLDMLQVEGIVLTVLAGELKWINIFGAILGALIGLVEAASSVLLR